MNKKRILIVGSGNNFKDVALKLIKDNNIKINLPSIEEKKYNFDDYIIKTKKLKKGQ